MRRPQLTCQRRQRPGDGFRAGEKAAADPARFGPRRMSARTTGTGHRVWKSSPWREYDPEVMVDMMVFQLCQVGLEPRLAMSAVA